MTQKASAATQRRSVGRQLRAAREECFSDRADKELPVADAAAALRVNPRTIRRLENGEVKPNYTLVESACRLYGLAPEKTARILEMVDQADEDEWHEKYGQDIAPWLVQLLDLEAVADRIHIVESLVPGVCQTPAYAAALAVKSPKRVDDPDYARRLAAIRGQRAQNVFGRTENCVTLLLDEAALLRQVGGPKVMAEQVAHLRELDTKPNVSIHVLPFASGATAAHKGGVTILEFNDSKEPDIAYVETYLSGHYSVKPSMLVELRVRCASLLTQAIQLKEYTP
ncbi:helix-turn-helix domain-containing protein [Kineosporia babensis]|uniref:Helix-turn-helix domain-containing protein n=1 Tax=Kineosporia babensis TaxID=499548 RepID=A0A9X1NEN2_9ACTN|nr:helix-turn-helix transcriptional regulator [Kineosporia babensis]MCD5312728.1 helix-turn-helix domain-containing protein [Kineosporia babensis]